MSLTPPPLPAQLTAPPPIKLARTGMVIASLVIAMCVAFVLASNDLRKSAEPFVGVRANALANMLARYVVGWREWMQLAHVWQPSTAQELIAAMSSNAHKPVDELRAEIVSSVLGERDLDEDKLAKIVKKAPELIADVAYLNEMNDGAADVVRDKGDWFVRRHGWVAKLAHASATDWPEPEASILRHEAMLTATVIAGMSMVGCVMFIVSIVLLVKTFRRWRRGGLPAVVQRLDKGLAPCLIEAFAIYLFAYTVLLFSLHQLLPEWPSAIFYGVALVFVLIAMFWPRWRGMEKQVWSHALGFHRGAGLFNEMRAGIVGWITGLPLLIAAALLAPMIARWTGSDPTHPIVENLEDHGLGRWGIIALAVVWAPLVEETMFRGLLFPGLSSMTRWIVGALVSAFVFAVIHPQGWAGVPAIMAIALTMSSLRLVRGSLIAPMTAHALNNGLVALLLLFAV